MVLRLVGQIKSRKTGWKLTLPSQPGTPLFRRTTRKSLIHPFDRASANGLPVTASGKRSFIMDYVDLRIQIITPLL